MQGQEIESDVVQELSPEIQNVFRNESGNLKTKALVSDIVRVIGDSTNKAEQNRDKQKDGTSYFR